MTNEKEMHAAYFVAAVLKLEDIPDTQALKVSPMLFAAVVWVLYYDVDLPVPKIAKMFNTTVETISLVLTTTQTAKPEDIINKIWEYKDMAYDTGSEAAK